MALGDPELEENDPELEEKTEYEQKERLGGIAYNSQIPAPDAEEAQEDPPIAQQDPPSGAAASFRPMLGEFATFHRAALTPLSMRRIDAPTVRKERVKKKNEIEKKGRN